MWDSVKSLLSSAAPLLGSAVGGPMGGMVGNWIASELGDDVDPSDPVALEKAIKADPDAFLKLRELETRHKEKLQEMSLEVFKTEVADKGSARDRERDYVKSTGHVDYFMSALGFMIVVGFFSTLAMLAFSPNAAALNDSQPFNILLGVLGSGFMAVVGYYYGSSKGSNDKTKMGK